MATSVEYDAIPSTENQGTFFPIIPPSAPKSSNSYCRALFEAPCTALLGILVDGKEARRHSEEPRHRVRKHVGFTNRWRLPETVGSDLLANSQALKALRVPYNDSLIQLITAENPKKHVNLDTSQPYKFRLSDDRPVTCPEGSSRNGRSSKATPSTAPATLPQLGPIKKYIPANARPAKPQDIFLYHSKLSGSLGGPDVLLQCLGLSWELHRPFLQKSDTLSELLEGSPKPSPKTYYRSKVSETLDKYVNKSQFYTNDYQETPRSEKAEEVKDAEELHGLQHPKHISEKRVNNMVVIELDINEPLITQQAMAIALGNLYHDDVRVGRGDVVGVFTAAHVLRFKRLQEGCCKLMLKTITSASVCQYHKAAQKYRDNVVMAACERWMEINLVPFMSSQIQLREISFDMMRKILKSNRLFTYGEFSLYKMLSVWVFLQLNPSIQLMPSYSTILTYFNSLPKSSSLIDRDEGQQFADLFLSLRLSGITDMNSLDDIRTMNILPQSWIVKLLSHHYHSLQGGGDMSLLNDFNTSAVRQGFIIDEEPHYHSEVMSLHGFHFELKAVKRKAGSYSFFMQRLKPGDPILSFRECERHTFSMRADRTVHYSIRVQYFNADQECQTMTSPVHSQCFGLGNKTSKSETLFVEKAQVPLYVSFSLLFPPS